jgi:hydrogenase-4 component F
MVFGDPNPSQRSLKASHFPVIVHLVLILALGLYMPVFLNDWFHKAVELLR